MGEEMKVYKVLVGKPEGKKPHVRLRGRWGGVWSGFSWHRIGTGCGLL
jgi:hypothetical protein